jgi:hypothetical protein
VPQSLAGSQMRMPEMGFSPSPLCLPSGLEGGEAAPAALNAPCWGCSSVSLSAWPHRDQRRYLRKTTSAVKRLGTLLQGRRKVPVQSGGSAEAKDGMARGSVEKQPDWPTNRKERNPGAVPFPGLVGASPPSRGAGHRDQNLCI